MNSLAPRSPDAQRIAQDFKEFTYVVSHDLNSPVRGMVEFSKLLLTEHGDALNDEGKEYLSMIIESGGKLQAMLNGLLDYSRLNTIATKPALRTGEQVHSILENCQLILNEKIRASHAMIKIASMPPLSFDAEQFQQLICALLDNALTYHRPKAPPNILVYADIKEHEVEFTVRDEGIGIEPQFFHRVVQPFQRLHTYEEYPGVGMGLAIAKKVVEHHGGELWIEPGTGYGINVKFTLSL